MPSKPFYEEGLHIGEVLEQGLTEAQTGTPQFMLKMKILGTPANDGSYEPHRNQYERTMFMALTEKTIPFVQEKLALLGFKGMSLAQLDPGSATFQSFAGQQVDLWCKHELYNGSLRERWDISNRSAMVKTPVEPKKLRQLDALFGRAQREVRAGGKPAPVSPPVDSEQITDDDIPF